MCLQQSYVRLLGLVHRAEWERQQARQRARGAFVREAMRRVLQRRLLPPRIVALPPGARPGFYWLRKHAPILARVLCMHLNGVRARASSKANNAHKANTVNNGNKGNAHKGLRVTSYAKGKEDLGK